MSNNRIKVAMICHFSDPKTRKRLPLSRMEGLNFVLRITKQHPFVYGDYAKWITNIADRCYQFPNIDMHIISPHFGLREKIYEYEDNTVHYHIFRSRPSFLLQGINRKLFGYGLSHYKKNYRIISKIINQLRPDIVVLVGAENPEYSGSVLNIEGIPIYVLCQTIFNNEEFKKFYNSKEFKYRSDIENKIFHKTPYVGVNNEKFHKLLLHNGYRGNIFHFEWVWNDNPQRIEGEKFYDFINFANSMSSQKGYHDSVRAMALVKKKFPEAKLVLVNNGPMQVQRELETLILDLGLEKNVSFIPYFPKQDDLFEFLKKVRFAVLPCKLDNIAGTMSQCLLRGIPIVVYKTTGTPSLNSERQCALIAKMDDVEELASHMISLMENPKLGEELSYNGIKMMEERLRSNNNSMERIINNLYAIIAHYKDKKPIPQEMLLN